MKRTFLLILAIILTFTLASCDNGTAVADTLPTETTTEEIITEADKSELILLENGKTDFKIIRSETAAGYYLDTAAAVNKKMKEEINSDFKIADDWINPREPAPEGTHEILLFDTNREESIAAREALTFDGYIIRVTDYKIVIAGTSPAACNEALYRFFDELIPQYTSDGKIAFPIGLEIKEEFKSTDLDIAAALREGKRKDTLRTEILEKYGLTVIRFTNHKIDKKFKAVCEEIDKTVKLRIKK